MILISVILALLAIFGAPLFAVIATSAMVGFLRDDVDLMQMALEVQSIASLPFLAAIPLFTFAGYLLSESNAPKRLVRLTGAMLGWMPGGLAIVSLAACAFFTAFTGASGALLEIEFEDEVLIDTPAWIAHLIVPLAFAVISYRFAVSIAWQVYRLITGDESEEDT